MLYFSHCSVTWLFREPGPMSGNYWHNKRGHASVWLWLSTAEVYSNAKADQSGHMINSITMIDTLPTRKT